MAAANQEFESKHPGVNVDVQYQTWGDHLSKFDATLAGGNTPDVIEMGNTEMTKYMAAGAFANLTSQKGSFAELEELAQGPRRFRDLQREDLRRPVLRGLARGHLPERPVRRAHAKTPTSLAQFTATAKRLGKQNSKKGFSPVYIAGTDWYFAMSFVYDFGGQIATLKNGKWVGQLESKKAQAGLAAYKRFFNAASRASKTGIENRPQPYDVYSQGKAASIVGPAWFSCCVGKKYTKTTKQFVMPSHVKGQGMPGFLGGSDLAVPERLERQVARGRLDPHLHQHIQREGPAGEGEHPERHQPARQQRQRAGGQAQLVRPDREELGQRGERQRPPHDAGPDPHREGEHRAGDRVRRQQHRAHAQPVATR